MQGKVRSRLNRIVKFAPLMIIAVLIVFTCFAASRISRDSRLKGVQRAEQAVRTAVMACYAAEGVYPPSVEYLEQYYGLSIDGTYYTVHYNTFGRNVMPDITVTVNN